MPPVSSGVSGAVPLSVGVSGERGKGVAEWQGVVPHVEGGSQGGLKCVQMC